MTNDFSGLSAVFEKTKPRFKTWRKESSARGEGWNCFKVMFQKYSQAVLPGMGLQGGAGALGGAGGGRGGLRGWSRGRGGRTSLPGHGAGSGVGAGSGGPLPAGQRRRRKQSRNVQRGQLAGPRRSLK